MSLTNLQIINKMQPLSITALAWWDEKSPAARVPTCRCMHWYTAAGCTTTSPHEAVITSYVAFQSSCVPAWNGKVGQQSHWEQQIHTSLHSRTVTLHPERAHPPCKQLFPCACQTILTRLLNVTSFLYIQHSLNQSSKQHMDENVSCQLANKGCEVPIIRTNSCNYRF